MGSVTLCVQHLRSSDPRERDQAARVLWERFAPQLHGLVRRHLNSRIRRREDEHDVLQNAYASFCLGQRDGNATPANREELWKLLVRITMCTVVNTAHRHLAARRDVRREQAEGPQTVADTDFPNWLRDYADRGEPSHEEATIVLDELTRILSQLPPELRTLVLWKMDGFTNADIAAKIGRTVRSVELKMQVIRKRIAQGALEGPKPTEKERADLASK
jgi:DNA-directed RNA polymerase specialized sigma24 family protein